LPLWNIELAIQVPWSRTE